MAYAFAGTYGPAPITDKFGHPLTGLTVAIFETGTQNLVQLYTDRTMATPATNPTLTDDIGNLTFFCAPGQVDLSGNGGLLTVVILPDPADLATLDGSTFTGPVELAADPTDGLGAATKEYVDTHGGEGGGGSVASVFGRTGAVVALDADYSGFYDQIGAAATAQTNAETFATGAVATETTRAEGVEAGLASGISQDVQDRPGAAGAASVRAGIPTVAAGSSQGPVYDAVFGDSISWGTGSAHGLTDWATILGNLENRFNELPDMGVGFVSAGNPAGQSPGWSSRAAGALVAPFTIVSVTLGATATVTASAFPGVVPGQVVTVSSGTGTLAANTTVVSVSGGNCVLSAAPLTTGTATLSFSSIMTQGPTVPGTPNSWQMSSSQAIGDGVTSTGATITVASVTLTSGSKTATVASGGFPNVTPTLGVSGTGIAYNSHVYDVSGNTLTLDKPAVTSGTVTLTFTRVFRRVVVYYAKVNNGDNVTFTVVGGSASGSGSLSTHSAAGGIGSWDSGDQGPGVTGVYATGGAHSAGAGGGGVVILGARYYSNPVSGAIIDNFGFPGSFIGVWQSSTSGGLPGAWAQMVQAMAAAGTPYRRIYIVGGINDMTAGIGISTPTLIAAAFTTIQQTVAAVSPTTECVFVHEQYGDGLTSFASVGTVNNSPTLSSTNFTPGAISAPLVGSQMTGPGIAAGATVLAVTAGSPNTVTLDRNCTATATVTATEILGRGGPTNWAAVGAAVQAAAIAAGAAFVDLQAVGGDFSPRATFTGITTTTGLATVTNAGGWPGVAVGQRVGTLASSPAGFIEQDTLVQGVNGTTLTLTQPILVGAGPGTLNFYADTLGISSGGLHWGDTSQSLSGRDGHRLMANAIFSKLKSASPHFQPFGQFQTSVASDGAIRALLPTNIAGLGPSWAHFLSSTDTAPALQSGFVTAFDWPGFSMGAGGVTAVDAYVARSAVNVVQIGSALKIAGLTGATGGARYVGSTASGAPASGTFLLGDWITTSIGEIWICTTAGTVGSGCVFTKAGPSSTSITAIGTTSADTTGTTIATIISNNVLNLTATAATAGFTTLSTGVVAVVASGGTAYIKFTGTSGSTLTGLSLYSGTGTWTVTSGTSAVLPAFIPAVTGAYRVVAIGGGGSGGGGGTASSGLNLQRGGAGGGQGESKTQIQALIAGTAYTCTVGAGGGQVNGGAAGGHAGTTGNTGGNTIFAGTASLQASGGGGGNPGGASSTSDVGGGAYGVAVALAATISCTPGQGGPTGGLSGVTGGSAVGSGGGGGGGGGAAASGSTTGGAGGTGGNLDSPGGGVGGTTGASGTAAGTAGGAGAGAGAGGGGGGAAWSTASAGGTGGAGAPGMIQIEGPL